MGRYIGVDVGTSSVKTMMVDASGHLIAEAGCDITVSRPQPGWKEIDPDVWWNAVRETIAEVVATGGDAYNVLGIGVTGQMHTTVFVDADGRSIRPAIMWNDDRTAAIVDEVRERYLDAGEDYLAKLISTGSPASNLAWLKENEPESFERLATFLIGPDWIVFRLTGSLGTDYCEASTSSLFDITKHCWSENARSAIGIPANVFPAVRGSAVLAGTLLPDIADDLGLPHTVRVVVGTGDNPAAAIPTGTLVSGVPTVSLGTSGVLMLKRDAPDLIARGKNILFSLGGDDCATLVQGVVQACGLSMSWLMNDLLHEKDYSALDCKVSDELPSRDAPMFYPHLTGEKTIYADPTIRGALLGISSDVSRGDVMRAVMEGICLAFRQLADEMGLDCSSAGAVHAIGGGSKSSRWMQMLADILGMRVITLQGQASAGFGAALLAMLACGEVSRDAIGNVGVEKRAEYMPRKDACAAYSDRYQRYLRIHDALRGFTEG